MDYTFEDAFSNLPLHDLHIQLDVAMSVACGEPHSQALLARRAWEDMI